jgi:hypothetical protein
MDNLSDIDEKICSKCGDKKPLSDFVKNSKSKGGYARICKECRYIQIKLWKEKIPEYDKEYRKNNRENRNNTSKKYYRKNRETILSGRTWGEKEKHYYNEYRRNRKLKDPNYKTIENVRKRTREFLKQNKVLKQTTTQQIIGCSPTQFREHIENQFTEGMSWDLMGEHIHIDHIIPLSSAKTKDEILTLCHYTNLQPLWAKDNLSKSNKL